MTQKEFYEEQKSSLERKISMYKAEIEHLPKGNLFANTKRIKGKKYVQWEWSPEESPKEATIDNCPDESKKKRTYINKKNIEFARLLARRMYLKRLIKDKENELKCVSYYANHRTPPRHLELLSPDSPYSILLLDSELSDWENQPYPKSNKYPDELKVKAPKGEMVRSKSEAMIAQALFENNIPYRYENIHLISGQEIATDFTVLHPKTRQIILWEHFGKVDDPSYQRKMIAKLHRYFRAGYLPGKNLILTFEDSQNPISYIDVMEVVQKFFT